MSGLFKFPQIFEFPPFFSKQINERTWNAQLEYWDKLILDYCSHYRIWTLDINEEVTKGGQALFSNPRIDRTLKKEIIHEVLEYMVDQGHAEWASIGSNDRRQDEFKGKSTVLIYFKRPEEWANLISKYIDSTGQNGTVVTMYELAEGELVQTEEFFEINPLILRKALDILVSRKKAIVMKRANGKEIDGVKML
jgi:ESCRT-II complex subunit VPS25